MAKKLGKNSIWNKIRNGPYLGSGAKNDKNKTTFLTQTFKVGEKKVPYFNV